MHQSSQMLAPFCVCTNIQYVVKKAQNWSLFVVFLPLTFFAVLSHVVRGAPAHVVLEQWLARAAVLALP